MGIISRFLDPFHPRRMVSLVRKRGPESARVQRRKQAAEADVERIREDDKYFEPHAPANDDEA